jgi:preprotein translocase subunit SecE
MARQTRAQRAARREARGQDGAAPPRRPERPIANGDGGDGRPERRPEPRAPEQQHRTRHFRFIRESWGELQKVEWPTQSQVIQGTVVVIVACIIVGVYLWGADQVFKRLVQQVFLGQ